MAAFPLQQTVRRGKGPSAEPEAWCQPQKTLSRKFKIFQYLKNGPLDFCKNWHAALKWRVMTMRKRCFLPANVSESRYCVFLCFWGVVKMGFLDFSLFCVVLVCVCVIVRVLLSLCVCVCVRV